MRGDSVEDRGQNCMTTFPGGITATVNNCDSVAAFALTVADHGGHSFHTLYAEKGDGPCPQASVVVTS